MTDKLEPAKRARIPLSPEEAAMRRPPPPWVLMDALTDRPAVPAGKVRIAPVYRRKQKEPT